MLLVDADAERLKEYYGPAALICSVIANVNRDERTKSEPYKPADFMPGADPHNDWDDFIEFIENGETPDVEPTAMLVFRRQLEGTFKNVVSQ